jgi:hypothetical protein
MSISKTTFHRSNIFLKAKLRKTSLPVRGLRFNRLKSFPFLTNATLYFSISSGEFHETSFDISCTQLFIFAG